MMVLIILVVVYLLGLVFFIGIKFDQGWHWDSELLAMIFWPLTLPLFGLLRWWQWGGARKHYRYRDTKWYQRGEKTRR